MKENALELAKQWTENTYFDQKDRNELTELLTKMPESEPEILDRFYSNLEFGTGGLRSIIGFGPNRMNKYNIRKATQAMCNTVLKNKIENPKACVSYDNRRFSREFAQNVASVFAANGIKTYIFKELTPTPILSYAVRYVGASCGVMVTASHNPKQYNGFKAYWSDGAQVTPPFDKEIIEEYNQIQDWQSLKMADFDAAISDHMIEWIGDELIDSFYELTKENALNPKMCQENGDKVHFIYTPLHGCGHKACVRVSKMLGFSNFEVVESQAEYDSEFSTLSSTPNPEDPKALSLAVALMKEKNADVAYGTDPDCDRLGVVVNDKGIERFLNGNQIAILMLHYLFSQKKEQGKLPANPLVIKSIVTSPLQKTIVEAFDGTIIDTLTGFKWMAKKLAELEEKASPYDFIFASEESFGYMPHNKVRDKDAVGAIALMNEITLYYKLKNKNLIEALDDIYKTYGLAQESLIALSFEGIEGREKINKIMTYFRNHFNNDIAQRKVEVFKDYSTSKEVTLKTNQSKKIEMTQSNVLGFELSDGTILYLRPSGTEPKIKFYTMVQIKEGTLEQKKESAQKTINEIESFIHATVENI